jgi:hypothetical protein
MALLTERRPRNGALPLGKVHSVSPGFQVQRPYPLNKLGMIGRAYAREVAADEIAQFS